MLHRKNTRMVLRLSNATNEPRAITRPERAGSIRLFGGCSQGYVFSRSAMSPSFVCFSTRSLASSGRSQTPTERINFVRYCSCGFDITIEGMSKSIKATFQFMEQPADLPCDLFCGEHADSYGVLDIPAMLS